MATDFMIAENAFVDRQLLVALRPGYQAGEVDPTPLPAQGRRTNGGLQEASLRETCPSGGSDCATQKGGHTSSLLRKQQVLRESEGCDAQPAHGVR